MVDYIIWSPVEYYIKGIEAALMIVIGFIYIWKSRKIEVKNQRIILALFGALMFLMFLSKLMFHLSDLYVIGFYENTNFYGNFTNVESTYNDLFRIACFIDGILAILITFTFEKQLINSKYVLPSISIISALMILFSPYYYGFHMVSSILSAIPIMIYLLRMTKRSSPEFAPIAFVILIGYMIYWNGSGLNDPGIKASGAFIIWVPPLVAIFGLLY